MKSVEWKTYRTRFLVKAKQLSSSLTFVDPLGRQHSGRKGDYLVESDGMLRIAPRQIFEDIYVTISPREAEKNDAGKNKSKREPEANGDREKLVLTNEILDRHLVINDVRISPARRKPVQKIAPPSRPSQPHRRKLPQPCRDPRTPDSGLGIM
jgi:hypothetical protein